MAKSKKEVKSKNFYLTIFDLIKDGLNPAGIQRKLGISKQNIKYYTDYLKKEGYINNIGYGTWEVKKEVKTSSLGKKVEKPTTNLHALQITIPILKGKIKDSNWQLKNKLNNWIPKYKGLDILGGLTIRNNNNKSITIFAKTRDIKDLNEVDNLSFKIRAYMSQYMRLKGVVLDVFNAKVTNLNLATEDKESESMIRKGEKFELDLKKKSEKIFQKDNIDGKAWIDGSPFKFSTETNDLEWKREYLSMPFRIRDMLRVFPKIVNNLNYVAENYKSHVGMVEEGHKLFKKLNRKLSQTTLLRFTKKA